MATTKKKAEKAVEKESAVRQFTTKQQRLIDCYGGDIKEAAEKAGLSYDYARRLVTKRHIFQAIRNRQDTELRTNDIADRQERQAFWTQMMRDGKEDAKDRLKASELLGKSEMDFRDGANVNLNVVTIADIFARTGCKRLPIIDAPALPSGDLTEGVNGQNGYERTDAPHARANL